MMIREPLVQATYFYLREAPGDSPSRRQDHHAAFVTDVYRTMQSLAGWLSLTVPDMPVIAAWESEAPRYVQPLMESGVLAGRTNATAMLGAYVLRNMFLLRVVVSRSGEHEQDVWALLDDTLKGAPTTPSWLYTTRYWCAIAPRPPEDLEQERLHPVKTVFGVLCLGNGARSNLLVYPDARTENRASAFLRTLAAELDWYTVQARHRREEYESHASNAARHQQLALEQAAHAAQAWTSPAQSGQLQTLGPLRTELDALESVYSDMLDDLRMTRAAAHEMRTLAAEYQLKLMEHGLWDAAPTLWQARVAGLAEIQAQIEADVQHVDATLRRIELLSGTLQTRTTLLQGDRVRFLIYLVTLLGLSLLAVLIADTSLTRVAIRLVALAVVAGIVWLAWQSWLRARLP
jgi:hypothetical protein